MMSIDIPVKSREPQSERDTLIRMKKQNAS